jgi:hypothetical protein
MVAIKSYTSLEQSKKLAEILPMESADMCYRIVAYNPNDTHVYQPYCFVGTLESDIPAWSLAALIKVLPADYIVHKHYFLEISKMGDNAKPYEVRYFRFRGQSDGADFGRITHISFQSDNPVDVCVEMIITLHEQKIL